MKIDRVDFTRFDKDRLYPENYNEHNNNNKWNKKNKNEQNWQQIGSWVKWKFHFESIETN